MTYSLSAPAASETQGLVFREFHRPRTFPLTSTNYIPYIPTIRDHIIYSFSGHENTPVYRELLYILGS